MNNKWIITTVVLGSLLLITLSFMGGYFLSRNNNQTRNDYYNDVYVNEAKENTQIEANQNNRPEDPSVSIERATQIAYEDLRSRGIPANFRAHSGISLERGQWVWELEFSPSQGGVIEYYINVTTGAIVKFEWDR